MSFVPSDTPPPYSDDDLAQRFSERHAGDLRFVHRWGQWLAWDGQRWRRDDTLYAFDCARAVARDAAAEAITDMRSKSPTGIASAKTVAAIDRLARADRRHASVPGEWDADPWLLNTPGGTVDLTTGRLRPHCRDDRMTKITAVAPGGDCPRWSAFLERVFDGDHEHIAFMRRIVGYGLTGSIREHALFFFYGTGANGKGVFLNTMRGILGEYAAVAPMDTFTASWTDRHPTDLAMLRGARTVIAQETEAGHRWAEAKIKALTGGDPISARFMRQDFFTYLPQFTLLIAGNHKPSLQTVDEAIRRRFYLIPFSVTIPPEERDEQLLDILKAEWPGILAWAIAGCVDWQRDGLAPPVAVRKATAGYLTDEDAVGRFLAEWYEPDPDGLIEIRGTLFDAWCVWCKKTKECAGTAKAFSAHLAGRYARREHPSTRRMCLVGLQLRSTPQYPPASDLDAIHSLHPANLPPFDPSQAVDRR